MKPSALLNILTTFLLAILLIILIACGAVISEPLPGKRKKKVRKVHIFLAYKDWHDTQAMKHFVRVKFKEQGQRLRVKTHRVEFPFPKETDPTKVNNSVFLNKVKDYLNEHIANNYKRYNNRFKVVVVPYAGIAGIADSVCPLRPFRQRVAIVFGGKEFRGDARGETLTYLAIIHELGHLFGAYHFSKGTFSEEPWDNNCIMSTYLHGVAWREWESGNQSYFPDWCDEAKAQMRRCLGS